MGLMRWSAIIGAAAAFSLFAAKAEADVLEIGDDGSAQWIAGGAGSGPAGVSGLSGGAGATGPSQPSMIQPSTIQPPTILPDDFPLPALGIADPAYQARLVPPPYAAKVHELAARYGLSPTLIEALVWQESRWNPAARSWAGARGLAQLMPGTAREMGVNPDDPYANLEGGARYLRIQLDRFNGDLEKALAAYNAGPARVARAGGVPNIRETKAYVAAIMGRLSGHSKSDGSK